jgi:thymidylate synthase
MCDTYAIVYVRVYLVDYIFYIIDYHIYRDIFDMLYILYNRLSYMSGYIW